MLRCREPAQLGDVPRVPRSAHDAHVTGFALRAKWFAPRNFRAANLDASIVKADKRLNACSDHRNACAAAFLLFALRALIPIGLGRRMDEIVDLRRADLPA